MARLILIFLVSAVLFSCKEKKPSLDGEEVVEIQDFIEFFPEITLPLKVTDSSLALKKADSSAIGLKVFHQFIPDTVLKKDFGQAGKPRLFPMGRVKEKGKETYLFVKAVQGSKRVGYLICFDSDDKFLNSLPIVRSGFDPNYTSYGLLDKKFQITTYRERRKEGGTTYKKNVYVYNSSVNDFTLILTEPNQDIIENIINPIDTLPKKNKYTGDYPKDKQNFISFRDGKNPSEIQFFVHFERDKGECNGELKGTARFTSPTKAVYKENGNPCTLEFTFTSSNVSMKEVEGCGSYREIKCFFEGKFPKKKEVKPKPDKKKK